MHLYRNYLSLVIFVFLAAGCRHHSNADASDGSGQASVPTTKMPITSIRGTWSGLFKPTQDDEMELDKASGSFEPVPIHTITFFIDKMNDGKLSGHSICAGLDRPFSGVYTEDDSLIKARLNEPSGDKHGGTFVLEINKNQFLLVGSWEPFDHHLGYRNYTLTRKNFSYDPSAGIHPEASLRLLKEDDLNNLQKEELRQMRNEIYARHGYAFKVREVQHFFDGQPWYMPISLDVRKSLTSIEKSNEIAIKSYEKYANETEDDYGR